MCVICMNIKSSVKVQETHFYLNIYPTSHTFKIPKVWDFLFRDSTLSYGVIGNTSDFGSEIQGSSPCGTTKQSIMSRGIIGNTSDSGSEVPGSSPGGTTRRL